MARNTEEREPLPEHTLGLSEDRASEEDEPDTQATKRTRFEESGGSMRLAEGGAGRKIPPPEE